MRSFSFVDVNTMTEPRKTVPYSVYDLLLVDCQSCVFCMERSYPNYFTKLNPQSGCDQTRVKEEDVHKTIVSTGLTLQNYPLEH